MNPRRMVEVDRFLVTFSMAVRAIVVEDKRVADDAVEDVRAAYKKVCEIDALPEYTDVAAAWWRSCLLQVSTWLNADDELRAALTDGVVRSLDTLSKWIDGKLVPPRDMRLETARAIGGG